MNQDRTWAKRDGCIGERLGSPGIALVPVVAAVLKERRDLDRRTLGRCPRGRLCCVKAGSADMPPLS